MKDKAITSESLRELEANLRKIRQDREEILSEILEKKKHIDELTNKLEAEKQLILDKFQQQKQLLENLVHETNAEIVELEDKLFKKQNGLLSKLFTSPQAISDLQTELKEQNHISQTQKLGLEESNNSLDFDNTISKDFSTNLFLSKFIPQKEAFELQRKELDEAKKQLEQLNTKYENCKANIDIDTDLVRFKQYEKVNDAFKLLMKSNKI